MEALLTRLVGVWAGGVSLRVSSCPSLSCVCVCVWMTSECVCVCVCVCVSWSEELRVQRGSAWLGWAGGGGRGGVVTEGSGVLEECLPDEHGERAQRDSAQSRGTEPLSFPALPARSGSGDAAARGPCPLLSLPPGPL